MLTSSSKCSRRSFSSYENVLPIDFGTLPIPVLKRIFHFINKHELLKNISLVCKQWRHATMQPEFLHSFSVSGDKIPLPYIYNHLRKSLKLKALHIENFKNPLVILLQASKCVDGLTSLSMTNCDGLPQNILGHIVYLFPKLQKVNLEKSYVIGDSQQYSKLLKLTDLRSLNLTKINNLNMQNLLEIILNCRKLEELDISLLPPTLDLNDDDACLIINNKINKLKSLSIDCRSLTNRTFQKIFACKHLKRLYLNFAAHLSSELLIDFWKYFPKIKQLGFRNNFILKGQDFMKLFKDGASVYKNLILLDFTFCVLLTDEALEIIAKYCKQLQKIYLKSCRSITSVVSICEECEELIFLDISYCTGIYEVFEIPKNLETLIIHQWYLTLLQNLNVKVNNRINIYLSLSEFSDEMELCYRNKHLNNILNRY